MGEGKENHLDSVFLEGVRTYLRPFLTLINKDSQEPRPSLVVGVSGGSDSLALLHCLRRILGPKALVVAHVNHGLRVQADEDARYVAQIATTWGIPSEIKEEDVTRVAADNRWGIEEAGRYTRYNFFAEVAAKYGATVAAVAHNANDQAETILMHLLRGSGVAGLRGMSLVGNVPGNEDLMLIRPFLTTSRADIEAYCQMHQLQPREDESNQDTIYFRNKIRHELLPILEDFNPQIRKHMQQLSSIVAADYDLLHAQFVSVWAELQIEKGQGWLQVSRKKWQELPVSQQRMALREGILTLRPTQTEISFQVIEHARMLGLQERSGTQMDLPGNVTLLVDYHMLHFTDAPQNVPITVPQIESVMALSIPGELVLPNGWVLQASVTDIDVALVKKQASVMSVFVDVDVETELFVRGRLAGERIQPLGMGGKSAKLKDVMINRKVARSVRQNWPLIVTAEHPVWLIGQMIDHRVQISVKTKRIIQLRCMQQDDA